MLFMIVLFCYMHHVGLHTNPANEFMLKIDAIFRKGDQTMMRKRVVAGLLALSLALIPVGASAASYRMKNYCSKGFKTGSGSLTASVKYTKNTGILKDTVECSTNTYGSIAVKVKCCYNETAYYTKILVGDNALDRTKAKKKVSSTNCYGKLSLTGDTQNTLYADE